MMDNPFNECETTVFERLSKFFSNPKAENRENSRENLERKLICNYKRVRSLKFYFLYVAHDSML